MKIAQISPYDFSHYGGVQRHISSLSSHLQSRGHEVIILSPCSKINPAIALKNTEFRSLGSTIPIPFAGSVARISPYLRNKKRIQKIFEDEKFDIVHVHEPFVPIISLAATSISNVPVIGTFHTFNEKEPIIFTLGKYLLRNTADKLSAKIAVSESSKNYVNKFFPGEYNVIPNGIDIKKFSTVKPYPNIFDKSSYNLLFVGRINESRKGLNWLIKAYSIIKKQRSDIRLIVAGEGNPNSEINKIILRRSLDNIIFTGAVSDEDLIAFYQHADIFCAPNTGNESFGFIILEAMAASTPVIASNISGFRSVMKNNIHGFFVKPSNEIDLAESILILINNPSSRKKFGLNGLNTSYKYSWDNISEKVINIYERFG